MDDVLRMKRMLAAISVSGREVPCLPEVPQAARSCRRQREQFLQAESFLLSTRETSPGEWDAAKSFLIGLQLDCAAMTAAQHATSGGP